MPNQDMQHRDGADALRTAWISSRRPADTAPGTACKCPPAGDLAGKYALGSLKAQGARNAEQLEETLGAGGWRHSERTG